MHQENKTSIKIADGDWHATIDLLHGANCISLRNEKYGANLLREPPDISAMTENPFLYGMPTLFPVNRIENGRFTFEGREYIFPINEPSTNCQNSPFSREEAGFDHIKPQEKKIYFSKIYLEEI